MFLVYSFENSGCMDWHGKKARAKEIDSITNQLHSGFDDFPTSIWSDSWNFHFYISRLVPCINRWRLSDTWNTALIRWWTLSRRYTIICFPCMWNMNRKRFQGKGRLSAYHVFVTCWTDWFYYIIFWLRPIFKILHIVHVLLLVLCLVTSQYLVQLLSQGIGGAS